MSFLAPAAFFFAIALPAVIVFYLLKRRRVARLVPSTLLWQRFLSESQANAPFQRLRRHWLLVLQLALLALVVLAAARPFFHGTAGTSRIRVLILDASASMQATDVKPSRFARAREEALRLVDGMRDGEQMMVLLAGATAEVRQSPTSDRAALRRALAGCEATDAPTRLADALKTAGAFTFEKRGEETVTSGEIHLFSDGAAADLDAFADRNLPLIYHRAGAAAGPDTGPDNLGITRLDVRGHPDDPAQRAVFATVANPAARPATAEVELLLDGAAVARRTVTIGATNSELVVFTAPQRSNGVFTVRLPAADDLAADNQASAVSVLPRPIRILLVTRGNRFLEKALRGATQAQVVTATQFNGPAEDWDVVVLDDILPATWPRANVLALHVAPPQLFPAWKPEVAPPIVDWKTTHPLLRFVSFDNVQIAEAMAVQPPSWGVPLVDSPRTPLILAGEIERQRVVWVGFDPLQSTWPLRVGFPIFIANAMDWLGPLSGDANRLMVQPGTAFRWPLPPPPAAPVTSAMLRGPDGTQRTLTVEPGARELVVTDTARQGVYHLQAGTNAATFAVNLMDARETDIRPRDELTLGRYSAVEATRRREANAEVWRWLALAGLALLMFEWWYYHRRSA